VGELLAHAKAMESEALERYLELAEQMEVHHNPEVAELFRKMARVERKHVEKILQPLDLSEAEVRDLLAFLQSLTDGSLAEELTRAPASVTRRFSIS